MNLTTSSFPRSLLTEIRTELQLLGFVYKGRRWYEKPLNSEATGIVTLASNSHRGDPAIYINPSLGVRHERIERLLNELCHQTATKFLPATIGTSLGYATSAGKHIMYSFLPGANTKSDVTRLVRAIAQDGLKWMEGNHTINAILEGLVGFKYAPRDHARFRIPLIYYIKADYESSRVSIQKGLEEIGKNQDAYSEQYRLLANGLSGRLVHP
jgi:hypothetical protein